MPWNPRHAYTNTPDSFFFGRPWQCQACGRPVHAETEEFEEMEWETDPAGKITVSKMVITRRVTIECHGATYVMEKQL